MARIRIYLHPKCYSSYRLYLFMRREGLLDRGVELIDTSKRPFIAISRGIISVPAVECDGRVVFQGMVDREILRKLIDGGWPVIEPSNMVERFAAGIADSLTASSWAYLTWSTRELADLAEFAMAVTGIIFSEDPSKHTGNTSESCPA